MTCSHCGQMRPDYEFRRGRSGRLRSPCRSCGAAYNRARRKADPDRFRRYDKRKYTLHREAIRAKQNQRDRSGDKARQRDQYAASPERRAEIRRKRDLWRKENPEKMREQALRTSKSRRARVKGARVVESITRSHVQAMLEAQSGKCFYCHGEMAKPTLDHFYPLSKGGEHSRANIVLACESCNKRKYNKDPHQFIAAMEVAA